MRFSLKYGVVAAVIGLNLFVGALLVNALLQARAQKEEETRRTVENLVGLLELGLTASADKVDLSLRQVVHELEEGFRGNRQLEEVTVSAALELHKSWVSGIADFRVTNETGQVRFGPGVSPESRASYGDRDFFARHRSDPNAGLIVTNPILGKVSRTWIVSFTRRFNRPDGTFAGVVSAAVPVSYFGDHLSHLDLGPHGIALLRDSETGLIARSPSSELPGQQIGGKVYSTELAQIMASGVEASTFHTLQAGDGKERINSYRRLKAIPFHAVVGMGAEDYLVPWRHEARKAAIVVFSFLTFSGVLGGLLFRSIDRTEAARRRSDLLLNNSVDGVYVVKTDGTLLFASRSFYEALDYDAVTPPPLKVSDWDTQRIGEEVVRNVVERFGTSQIFETKHRRRDGSVFDVEVHAQGIELDGQRVLYASARDVTERRLVEEALRDSEERFRFAMEASNDGLWDWDIPSDTAYFSPAYFRMLGYEPDEIPMTGQTWADLIHPEDRQHAMAAANECIENRCDSIFSEFRMKTKSGSWRWILGRGRAIHRAPDGRALRMIGTNVDITERKAIEKGLLHSNAELEQFAYVASHDLREPLRMVSSYLSLLERRYSDHLDEAAREFIGFARDGAKRLDRLVLDLLEFSRVNRGGEAITAMPIMPAVQLALTNLGMAIKDSGATITVDDAIRSSWVMGDPTQVMRLFQNLIGNALKYRKPDVTPIIRIDGRHLDRHWEFSVGDNGIGITPEYFERIFGIFQRLHAREEYDGTGIGLAISKKIIERHSGSIWLASMPDDGTTFYFTLPEGSVPT